MARLPNFGCVCQTKKSLFRFSSGKVSSAAFTSSPYRSMVGESEVLGSLLATSSPRVCQVNLLVGSDPTGVFVYTSAMSLAVSDAVQKYGGDSTHPIWREVGTTSLVGLTSGCSRI